MKPSERFANECAAYRVKAEESAGALYQVYHAKADALFCATGIVREYEAQQEGEIERLKKQLSLEVNLRHKMLCKSLPQTCGCGACEWNGTAKGFYFWGGKMYHRDVISFCPKCGEKLEAKK